MPRRAALPLLLCLCVFASFNAPASGGDVPLGHADFKPTPERPIGWRGDGSGVFPGATPVTEWDYETGKNIIWKAETPYWGTPSPIVVDGKVITACEPHTLLAYDAETGKLLWHNSKDNLDALPPAADAEKIRKDWAELMSSKVGKNASKEHQRFYDMGFTGLRHRAQGHTFPTPITDGKYIYIAWGLNTMGCYDVKTGKTIWLRCWGKVINSGNGLKRNVEQSQCSSWNERWVASPLLADGVLVAWQGAVLRGVDAKTGKKLWDWHLSKNVEAVYKEHDKLVRRDGPQAHWGCATPVKLKLEGTWVLVTGHGVCVRFKDGKVLSPYIGAMADVSGGSPVTNGTDTVYMFDYQDGGRGCSTDETWAVKLAFDGPDKVVGKVLWHKRHPSQTGSPLLADGILYTKSLKGVVAATGEKAGPDPRRISGGYESPAKAGEYYFHFRNAEGTVLSRTGGNWKKVGGGDLHKTLSKRDKTYDTALRRRAEQAVKDGIIPYVDRLPAHGQTEGMYGSSPFFQGDRMYVRTRLALFCIGPKKN